MDQDTRLPQESEPPATESVEQYMRLHDHIERLREDQRPSRPGALAPDDVRAYHMAALFRAAAPGAADPDPAFVASLRTRIRQELAPTPHVSPPASLPVAASSPVPTTTARQRRGVSRRTVLGAGLSAAAAGVAAGVALGRVTEPGSPSAPSVAIVPDGSGIWVTVAAVQEIPLGGVKRFATDAIVGFVRHTSSGFTALSGVCTHMGCLLQWNGAARTYDCPCHGGRFSEDGSSASASPVWYKPLAQITTRVQGNSVQVYVPPTAETAGGNPTLRQFDGSSYPGGH